MVLVPDAWSFICVCMLNKQAGGADNPGGTRKRLPKLKIPAKIWSHRKQNQDGGQNQHGDDQPDGGHEEEEEEQQEEERLDDLSRKLILREEQLFTRDGHSEEEEDQLLKDFESLSVRLWMAVHSSFDAPAGHPDVLRSAVDAVLEQETQDRRWTERPADSAPVWRPLRWLRTHNQLLQKIVEKRLKDAGEDETGDTGQLSSVTKRQVCRLGKRVKEDLLMAAVALRDCHPSRLDILNLYGGLYHQAFAARLAQLSSSELDLDDCSYLLFWVNHYYPDEILKHKELDGIKTACLGSLLLTDTLRRLEEQYMSHRQGCSSAPWLSEIFFGVAEILRLQDPAIVHLEVVDLARRFPDFSRCPSVSEQSVGPLSRAAAERKLRGSRALRFNSDVKRPQLDRRCSVSSQGTMAFCFPMHAGDAHVSALLSLKFGLSAADVRSIRASVEENRPLDASANQSHPFFSRPLPPAPPEESQGVPRPAERHSPSSVSWVSPGPPPGGTCPELLTREASRRHPDQMPEPPQLAPLDVKEQRLYSESLPDFLSFSPYL
ncbi:hypothetical protein CCH79_00019015 [Gambusia affinis]|uniref:Uncharacterized protein n=1 Tax=Gambusia affinis TaxID=33528 RepID=A0A315VYA5_GAMAF|nr:hypothetical protein CCH79_00019015 [Gambusia affinis]